MPRNIEDLLEENPNLEDAVRLLIGGCMGSSMGHKALDQWNSVLLGESGVLDVSIPREVAELGLVDWLNDALESVGSTLLFAPKVGDSKAYELVTREIHREAKKKALAKLKSGAPSGSSGYPPVVEWFNSPPLSYEDKKVFDKARREMELMWEAAGEAPLHETVHCDNLLDFEKAFSKARFYGYLISPSDEGKNRGFTALSAPRTVSYSLPMMTYLREKEDLRIREDSGIPIVAAKSVAFRLGEPKVLKFGGSSEQD